MVIFFDIESFYRFWCFCGYDTITQEEFVFHNNPSSFAKWFDEKRTAEIFAAHNLNGYDKHIVNAIYYDKSPQEINQISHDIVNNHIYPFQKRVSFIGFDTMPEGKTNRVSLKQLEAYAGHSIIESAIPFDCTDVFTKDMIDETLYYCMNDVKEGAKYLESKDDELRGKINVCKQFNLSLTNISKTKGQLAELVLGMKQGNFPLEKIPYVLDYNLIPKDVFTYYDSLNFMKYQFDFKTIDASGMAVIHTLGAGGTHGARKSYYSNDLHWHADAESFYPNTMRKYNLLSRACTKPELLSFLIDMRIKAKREGKKELSYALKILINAIYGISGAEFSPAYDKTMSYAVTINGQLMLMTLMLMIKEYCWIINSNTDGLIIKVIDEDKVLSKFQEWMDWCGMKLDTHDVTRIVQKDVNNYYIEVEGDDEPTTKGSFFKQPRHYDCDLVSCGIANVALVNYFNNIPIDKTLNDETELRKFQSIVKLTDSYDGVRYIENRKETDIKQKINRVFAVKNGGFIGKVRNGKVNRFGSVPDSCIIVNDDITDWTPKTLFEKTGKELDYAYYKEFSEKRLYQLLYGDTPPKTQNRMRLNKKLSDY